MIKYRPHRGTLEEAMEGYREFENYDELKQFVCDDWSSYYKDINGVVPFTVDDIVLGEIIGDDNRIGWKNVRHICVKRMGHKDFIEMYGTPQAIAWCGE